MIRKILLSAGMLIFAGVAIAGATGAFFNDVEVSTGNTFAAGEIDLTVDSEQHYNHMVCVVNTQTEQGGDYYWQPEVGFQVPVGHYPAQGTSCDGTWALSNLVQGVQKFFNFSDIKPGDEGENTISLHITSNPAWACVDVNVTANDDNGLTEPEGVVDVTGGAGQGELAQNINFAAWLDQGSQLGWQGKCAPAQTSGCDLGEGDNIWQGSTFEPLLFSNQSGPASDVLGGKSYPLADSSTGFGPMAPGITNYIGLQWCAGSQAIVGNTITCNGATLGNIVQSDSFVADVTFRVEQSRNNPNFRCTPPVVVRPLVGAANYSVPEVPGCNITANDDGAASVGFTNGLNAISTAITQATPGQTICVAPGTYNEFTVDKSVTILGLSDPEGGTPAVVIPSSSSVTDLALVNASNVTITGLKFDGNSTVTAGQTAGVRVSPTIASLSGVNINYNVVTNIAAATGFASKGIQWFTDVDSGFVLSNSSFNHNTISNISAVNKGGYGVQTVGAMSNVAINNNTISNTTGAWGAGVAVDTKNTTLTPVTGSTINRNQILTGVSDGVSRFSVQVENRVDATGVVVNQNNIETSVHGGGNAPFGTEGSLNAQSNWWGVAVPVLLTDVFNSGANVTDFTLPEASAFVLN